MESRPARGGAPDPAIYGETCGTSDVTPIVRSSPGQASQKTRRLARSIHPAISVSEPVCTRPQCIVRRNGHGVTVSTKGKAVVESWRARRGRQPSSRRLSGSVTCSSRRRPGPLGCCPSLRDSLPSRPGSALQVAFLSDTLVRIGARPGGAGTRGATLRLPPPPLGPPGFGLPVAFAPSRRESRGPHFAGARRPDSGIPEGWEVAVAILARRSSRLTLGTASTSSWHGGSFGQVGEVSLPSISRTKRAKREEKRSRANKTKVPKRPTSWRVIEQWW